jgi:hypothetical protein
MFAPCINSIKNTFIVPTDAHYYIIEILKQFKSITLAPTCFGSSITIFVILAKDRTVP